MAHSIPARHERRIVVTARDIDELGHVNNVVYLQWVQDLAAAHWEAASSEEDRAGVVWVAVKHEIEYKAPAFEGDSLRATTWVDRWTGVTSERHTEITREADGKLVARAKTTWCAVDPGSLRPKKVEDRLRELFEVSSRE